MATEAQERLASALEALAAQVAASPRSIVGMKVSAVAGPGSTANVTGQRISVTGGPGGGTVIGQKVEVNAGGPDPAADLVRELREAASAVRQDKGHRAWIQGLVGRVKALADRAIDAGIVSGVQQAITSAF